MKRWTLWLAGAAALVAGLAACPQFAPDDVCGYPGFCGDSSTGEGGKDSGTDGPATCPSGNEPKDDPSCVSDQLGIFVAPAPGGSDGNPGTKESPVATLKTALQKAASGSKGFIFVCEGNYTESVDITQTISIFGGFKCSDWSYTGSLPKFTATKSDYVLHLDTVSATLIADLELDAIDGLASTGQSSVGVFMASSQNVTLKRLTIHAGKGANGPTGVTTDYSFSDAGVMNGNSATNIDGGAPTSKLCPGGDSTAGGAGGYGNGSDGTDGTPGPSNKGTAVDCISNNAGGKAGKGGDAGANAAATTTLGNLGLTGWTPSPGAAAGSGSAGQGGGGGGGYGNGGGGGGGSGGCGGAPGLSGGGGGASIAVEAFASVATVTSCTLATEQAGNGGNGSTGQSGQSGGLNGTGFPPGCNGGTGGLGGTGGGGAGGAGGVSVGVLSKGGTITVDSATQSQITVAPSGGTKGTGAAGNDGIDGVAQAQLAL